MCQVKQALWMGGIQRSNKPPEKRNTPGLQSWQDLVSKVAVYTVLSGLTAEPVVIRLVVQTLIYAGQIMQDDKFLKEYQVPPVRFPPTSKHLSVTMHHRNVADTMMALTAQLSKGKHA